MNISQRLPRKSVAGLLTVAALALGALGATSASAAEWTQSETTMKWAASTITLKKEGASQVTCNWGSISGKPPVYGAVKTYGPSYLGGVTNDGYMFYTTQVSCPGSSPFSLCSCIGNAKSSGAGVYSLDLFNFFPGIPRYTSPYGEYVPQAAQGTFTNGSGGTPSTLVFKEAVIGKTYLPGPKGYESITLTGTFTVTTGTGGLLTLKG